MLIVLVALATGLGVLLARAAARATGIPTGTTTVPTGTATIPTGTATIPAGFLAALAANLGHVFTILADRFAALATGFTGFLRIKLMSSTLFVSCFATLAGNLALLVFVHRREATLTVTLVSTLV